MPAPVKTPGCVCFARKKKKLQPRTDVNIYYSAVIIFHCVCHLTRFSMIFRRRSLTSIPAVNVILAFTTRQCATGASTSIPQKQKEQQRCLVFHPNMCSINYHAVHSHSIIAPCMHAIHAKIHIYHPQRAPYMRAMHVNPHL